MQGRQTLVDTVVLCVFVCTTTNKRGLQSEQACSAECAIPHTFHFEMYCRSFWNSVKLSVPLSSSSSMQIMVRHASTLKAGKLTSGAERRGRVGEEGGLPTMEGGVCHQLQQAQSHPHNCMYYVVCIHACYVLVETISRTAGASAVEGPIMLHMYCCYSLPPTHMVYATPTHTVSLSLPNHPHCVYLS